MKNFKLFLESKDSASLFQQEVIVYNVTLATSYDNIKTKLIKGDLTIATKLYGDLSNIRVEGKVIIDPYINVTTLQNLPKTSSLVCSINSITSFKDLQLPSELKEIDCSHNKISTFEYIPTTLVSIRCSFNKITSFKHLPYELKELICDNNKLTSFKYLPSELTSLYCHGNQITNLDYLCENLIYIQLENNPIHKLYRKYDKFGTNTDIAYLLKALMLDSTIHTEDDIHPILDMMNPNDYKDYTEIIKISDMSLKTHTSQEIIELLSSL